jgi:hypothetical protein
MDAIAEIPLSIDRAAVDRWSATEPARIGADEVVA